MLAIQCLCTLVNPKLCPKPLHGKAIATENTNQIGWTCSAAQFTGVFFFHLFQEELQANLDLIQTYRLHIAQDINQENLQLFLGSYNGQSCLSFLLLTVQSSSKVCVTSKEADRRDNLLPLLSCLCGLTVLGWKSLDGFQRSLKKETVSSKTVVVSRLS